MAENPPNGDRTHDLRSGIYEQYKTYALDHSATAVRLIYILYPLCYILYYLLLNDQY